MSEPVEYEIIIRRINRDRYQAARETFTARDMEQIRADLDGLRETIWSRAFFRAVVSMIDMVDRRAAKEGAEVDCPVCKIRCIVAPEGWTDFDPVRSYNCSRCLRQVCIYCLDRTITSLVCSECLGKMASGDPCPPPKIGGGHAESERETVDAPGRERQGR